MRRPFSLLGIVTALLVVLPRKRNKVWAALNNNTTTTDTHFSSQVVVTLVETSTIATATATAAAPVTATDTATWDRNSNVDPTSMSIELSNQFRDVYNAYNNNTDFCDPLQRSLTYVEIEEITTDSNTTTATTTTTTSTTTFRLSIVGTCVDCDFHTNMFDDDDDTVGLFFAQLSRANPCINATNPIRSPTIQSFQQALQTWMESESMANRTAGSPSTSTSTTTTTNTTGMTLVNIQEQNAFWCTEEITPFNTTLTLDYYSVCETVEWGLLLEQVLLETYTTMLETDYCDPTFRLWESVVWADTILAEDRTLTLSFDVSGSCRGCSGDSLFHTQETSSLEQENNTISFGPWQGRQLQQQQQQQLRRQQALTGTCACPTTVTNRAPTHDEFKAQLDSILATLFKGVQCNVECPVTNRSVWEDLILVELTVLATSTTTNNNTTTNTSSCSSNTTSTTILEDTNLVADLENSYMEIYNEMQKNEYCDPYSRQLTSIDIVSVGERNTLGNIPIEMKVVGTCVDCDGLDMRVYDHPRPQTAGEDAFSRRRRLQSVAGTSCTCPILSVYDYTRAPFEAEFVSRYQRVVTGLEDKCVESVGECHFGTRFSTGIYLNVTTTQDMDLTDTDIRVLAESLEMALNLGYASNEVTCHSQFRTIDRVTAKVIPPNSSQDLEESTGTSKLLVLNLYVSGICNGCGNQLFVGDTSAESRRRSRHLHVAGGRHLRWNGERRLQQTSPPTLAMSNCYCPLGATIVNESPPRWHVMELFEMILEERVIPIVQIHSLLEFNLPSPELIEEENGPLLQECYEYENCGGWIA